MYIKWLEVEKLNFALIVFIVHISDMAIEADINCSYDGVQLDYENGCKEFSICFSGSVVYRGTCDKGMVYSLSTGHCVPRRESSCVPRTCDHDEKIAYVSPGSRCRQYYRCVNGTALDMLCPIGTWFDFERQACTKGAGACYEPLCVGLINGYYPDNSHNCKRLIECKGSVIRRFSPCYSPECSKNCESPRTTSVSLPVGQVDLCTDEPCTSFCLLKKDGSYPDLSTGCKDFFSCNQGQVMQRGVCEHGMIFSDGECKPEDKASCPSPEKGKCFGIADGPRRDWRDCRTWFVCRRDKVIAVGVCDINSVWDGFVCVPSSNFSCNGPYESQDCFGRPRGYYQDLNTDCRRYFRCESGMKFDFDCGIGKGFNGVSCASQKTFTCPSLDEESCYKKPDGKYGIKGSGCRGYYMCTTGEKSMYTCGPNLFFNGFSCEAENSSSCPPEERPCMSLSDGYHQDVGSECRRYFYCESGDRVASFECAGDKVFNGRRCVNPDEAECGMPKRDMKLLCEKDGFFTVPKTNCRNYFFCIQGRMTHLACKTGKVFNGSVCVPQNSFQCNV